MNHVKSRIRFLQILKHLSSNLQANGTCQNRTQKKKLFDGFTDKKQKTRKKSFWNPKNTKMLVRPTWLNTKKRFIKKNACRKKRSQIPPKKHDQLEIL